MITRTVCLFSLRTFVPTKVPFHYLLIKINPLVFYFFVKTFFRLRSSSAEKEVKLSTYCFVHTEYILDFLCARCCHRLRYAVLCFALAYRTIVRPKIRNIHLCSITRAVKIAYGGWAKHQHIEVFVIITQPSNTISLVVVHIIFCNSLRKGRSLVGRNYSLRKRSGFGLKQRLLLKIFKFSKHNFNCIFT